MLSRNIKSRKYEVHDIVILFPSMLFEVQTNTDTHECKYLYCEGTEPTQRT